MVQRYIRSFIARYIQACTGVAEAAPIAPPAPHYSQRLPGMLTDPTILVPSSNQQEKEALQAQIEAKEKEVEAAQEAAEAAGRAVSDRERQLAGQADASADKVGCLFVPAPLACLSVAALAAAGPLTFGELHSTSSRSVTAAPHSLWIASLVVVAQASQTERELETARAEVAQIRQQQDAERARVKKAIAEMKRKIDG